MPFSIINPSHLKNSDETKKFGRKYEWGFAESLNPKYSDFKLLHSLVSKYLRSELVSTMQQKYANIEP